ncbi:N2,N2-dimethylguanosine tRNA methyltransferase [Sphaceloma murrayae]|uniref:tRNA (guanine(26)-N(2))-dimethyltransferase n=1 Tax=Sphaceloma murrayae TaxID=2082308 RepID=A0A2K1R0Q4_9PEZI|nr:N2,N2-dimethylguanosine tRNA methyltransferase [Sphaceloma murrayae]
MATSTDQNSEATLETQPAAGQTVIHEGVRYTTIKEGLAHILVPPNAKTSVDPKAAGKGGGENAQNVFYNPIQQFNRDLSVLAIRAFSEDFSGRRKQRAQSKSKVHKQTAKHTNREKRMSSKVGAGDSQKPKDSVDPLGGELAAGNLEKPDDIVSSGYVSEPPQVAGTTTNAKKRKAEDDTNNEAEAKKTKIDAKTLDSEATGHGTENGAVDSRKQLGADSSSVAPDEASKLPTGQRPDDKLRPHLRILDALSATGLRALRYASELPIPTKVVANDLLATATRAINLNVTHNKLNHAITATTSNAQAHMYSAAFSYDSHAYGKYDVIDLDPYGTAVPFIEAALLALNDNGLLCVTCTDAGVFNSMGYLEKTYSLYGGIPVKGFHAHEAGLRLILHAIATAAAKHGFAIEPVLSLSIDFYARVFVRVRHSPNDVKYLASKTMVVHSCDIGCGAWSTQVLARTSLQKGKKGGEFVKYHPALATAERVCEHCQTKTHLAGPMWAGPLHNPWFIGRILSLLPDLDDEVYQTKSRIEGMLTSALDELEVLPDLDGEQRISDPRANNKKVAADKKSEQSDKQNSAPAAAQTEDQTHSPKVITGDEAADSLAKPATDSTSDSNKTREAQSNGQIPAVSSHIVDAHPFYFQPSALSGVIKCQAPPEAMIKGALRHLGYSATRTHAKPGMIKTQAPWSVIWEIMREWVKRHAPVKEGSLRVDSAGYRVLWPSGKPEATEGSGASEGEAMAVDGEKTERQEGEMETNGKPAEKSRIVFDEALGRDRPGKRLVRYQVNPRANWGPMTRAKG